ncbi:MAG: tRNA (cytidine(34)-2'-O)-methyltransferase [Lentisphaeria bacterium]|nr:tRNA (cytidine(34)-2'-O)-methyltransferase [Lentisphaeria bacterium]
MLSVVLVAPEIPQNTGTIGRLCVCTDARLHLIRPLGFSLDESRIRRAGLDYWQYVDCHVHETWEEFLGAPGTVPGRLVFCSTKAARSLYSVRFRDDDTLVFGNESSGLPPWFQARHGEDFAAIPMPGRHARSHNLANAVAIVVYEALRQLRWA